ncbi:MAG: hypothetical protein JSS72_06935 [Armatimonadetes bacterium]|nr:hypothetical protein [Armatimonadota bacterium]
MKVESQTHKLLLVLAALGFGLVIFAVLPHGAGITPDSVGYISVARHILSGQGFVDWSGQPFVEQPPLFPALLAAISFVTRQDPASLGGVLNALLFACTIYFGGLLAAQLATPRIAVLIAGTILFSRPLFETSIETWTEPLFNALLIGVLTVALTKRNSGWLIAFSIGLTLTRYAGIALVGCVGLYFILERERPALVARYFILSLLPVALWMVRNQLLTGHAAGERAPSITPFSRQVVDAGMVVAKWGIVSLLGISAYAVKRTPARDLFGLVAAGNLLFMILAASRTGIDTLNDRLLSASFLPLAILAGIAIQQEGRLIFRRAAAGLLALSTCVMGAYAGANALKMRRHGNFYTDPARIAQSKLDVPLDPASKIFSNDPWGIYLINGRECSFSPRQHYYQSSKPDPDSLPNFKKRIEAGERATLVWYDPNPESFLWDADSVASGLRYRSHPGSQNSTLYEFNEPH